jgi:hypothetical protein
LEGEISNTETDISSHKASRSTVEEPTEASRWSVGPLVGDQILFLSLPGEPQSYGLGGYIPAGLESNRIALLNLFAAMDPVLKQVLS